MNTTRKLSLNILGAFALGFLSQGCDSADQEKQASSSSQATQSSTTRSVNIKHRAKSPTECETAIQACVNTYQACTLDDPDCNTCAEKLHDCILVALGSDACLPDESEKKKKDSKKKKKKKAKKKGCDKEKDTSKEDKKKDECEKDFEDGDPDFEDGDPEFEDGDPEFEDGDPNFKDGKPDFELGDEDDIPDFEECEDMNFFTKIAENLGLSLKVAACKK